MRCYYIRLFLDFCLCLFLPCLISLSYVVASVFVFDDFDGDDELVLFSGDLSYMRSF